MGKIEQARIVERHQEHQHVAVLPLAADLVGIRPRGLVAVVPIRDQQLRVRERGLERGDLLGVGHSPEGVARALSVGRLGKRLPVHGLAERLRGRAAGIGEEAEDGGEVRARRPREPEPVLLRSRMGPLVRPNPTRAVVLHAHACEEPPARAGAAVRRRVVLPERPDGGLVLLDENSVPAPLVERLRRGLVALREVELDDVVGAPGGQLRPSLVIDHVVGRRDQILERPRDIGVVAKRPERLHICHRRATLARPDNRSRAATTAHLCMTCVQKVERVARVTAGHDPRLAGTGRSAAW